MFVVVCRVLVFVVCEFFFSSLVLLCVGLVVCCVFVVGVVSCLVVVA